MKRHAVSVTISPYRNEKDTIPQIQSCEGTCEAMCTECKDWESSALGQMVVLAHEAQEE